MQRELDDSRDVSPVCKDMEAEVSTNSRQISACVVWNCKQLRTKCQIVCTMRFQRVSKILTPRRMLLAARNPGYPEFRRICMPNNWD